MSVSTEDFLKSIYQLKYDQKVKASSSNVAERLRISNAAVTDMAKKLSAKGLIEYRKYKEMSLTREGEKLALRVIRRHRLWELFLKKVLGIDVTDVHHEAEMLEHQTSDFLADKIDEFLGYPDFDPHGDPIPDASGNMPESNNAPLTDSEEGMNYIIDRIYHTNEQNSFFDANKNLKVGQVIHVEQKFEADNSVAIRMENNKLVLNHNIALNIYVKEKL